MELMRELKEIKHLLITQHLGIPKKQVKQKAAEGGVETGQRASLSDFILSIRL